MTRQDGGEGGGRSAQAFGSAGSQVVAGDQNIVVSIGRESTEARELLDDYLTRLWGRLISLPLGAITRRGASDEDVALTEVFTAPDVTVTVAARWNPLDPRRRVEDLLDVERAVLSSDGTWRGRRMSAVAVVGGNERLMLKGVAGSGKSTFAKFLCLCMIGELQGSTELGLDVLNGPTPSGEPWPERYRPWPLAAHYPLYVECRQYVRSPQFRSNDGGNPATPLLRYFESEVAGRGADAVISKGESAALRRVLASDRALVVLDGLDEVDEADKHRHRLCSQVAALLRAYTGVRVLVTARPYAYRENSEWRLDGAGFGEADLADFDAAHIAAFCERWYARLVQRGLVDESHARERTTDLTQQAMAPGMQALGANPLMLTMVADLHWSQGGMLPPGRAELYERSVELLLDRWNQRRGLSDEKALAEDLGIKLADILRALEELALEVHSTAPEGTQAADIDAGDLWKALNRHRHYGQRADEARIMGYLHTRSGILVGESPHVYRFPHLSFQEYLAACVLTQDDDFPAQAINRALVDPTRWRDVIAFLAGTVAGKPMMIWALIEGLVPEAPDEFRDGPDPGDARYPLAFMAGQAIVAHGLHRTTVAARIRKLIPVRLWLRRTLEVGALSPHDRSEAGRALSALGDNRPGVGLNDVDIPAIAWIMLPAGTFTMGSANDDAMAWQDEKPPQIVSIAPFRIAKYPITVAQFRPFVLGDGYRESTYWTHEGWQWRHRVDRGQPELWGDDDFGDDNQPVIGITWHEAVAYCAWLSRKCGHVVRLPTEAEWEYAARGRDGRRFPWGDTFDAERCNTSESRMARTTAVGMYPLLDGYWAADPAVADHPLDMSGNVLEWTSTKWRNRLDTPMDDQLQGTASRVARGGSRDLDSGRARCAYRGHFIEVDSWVGYGIRVAAPLP